MSLAVKDLAASLAFYEKLGFEPIGGDQETHSILRNGDTVIGLFQGMFEQNILTFNPGWNQRQEQLEQFTDVREICQELRDRGVELQRHNTDDTPNGPAHAVLVDPDGNPVLIDQHVSG